MDWVQTTYSYELEQHSDKYPYMADFNTAERRATQIMTWFTIEWKNPRTNITPLEEFIDKFVKDPALAAKVSQFSQAIFSTFQIVQRLADCMYIVTDQVTKKKYRIRLQTAIPPYRGTLIFDGYIHPWEEDGTHQATGILLLRKVSPTPFITPDMQKSLFRMMMKDKQDKYESVSISATTKISTYLKNQPAELVNTVSGFLNVHGGRKKEKILGIRAALSGDGATRILEMLPQKELACLLYVHQSPQKTTKHGMLERQFGDDDFDPYETGRARSVIGRLREKGLLMVGKKTIGSRRYKVAAIPAELDMALDKLESPSV